jgi:hypothetical protein
MSRTHEQFLDELRASSEAVVLVAAWLTRERGLPVVLRPTFAAPTIDQRADYTDGGDLEILLGVEVKRRSLPFTNKADYPYPTVIVDACPSFDKKRPRPYAYVLLNETMTAALVVDVGRTRHSWTRADLLDGRNNFRQPFYVCPLDLVSEAVL